MYMHNMTSAERVQWEKLTDAVRHDFTRIDTGDIPRETLEKVVCDMTREVLMLYLNSQ